MFDAVVLAGGVGQRLRPYTEIDPKPMLKLGKKPILEFVLRNLKNNGFNNVIITTAYKSHSIIKHFNDGKSLNMHLEYSIEQKPMNTAGSLLLVKDKLGDDFIVVMGDHITSTNLRDMLDFHKQNNNILTVGTKVIKEAYEYGIIETQNGRMTGFKEKPIFSNYVNTGIYTMNKKVFDYIKEGEDIAKDLIPKLLNANEKVGTFNLEGFWKDIGRVKDYEKMRDLISVIEVYMELFK